MTHSKLQRISLSELEGLMLAEKELPVVPIWDIDAGVDIARKEQEEIFADYLISLLANKRRVNSLEEIASIILGIYWIYHRYQSPYILDLSSKLLSSQTNLDLAGFHGYIGRFLGFLSPTEDVRWLEFWADVVDN